MRNAEAHSFKVGSSFSFEYTDRHGIAANPQPTAKPNAARVLFIPPDPAATLRRSRSVSLDQISDPIAVALKILSQQCEATQDIDRLAQISASARRHGRQLSRNGVGADALTRYLTAVNDLLSHRIIDFALARFGQAPASWCWIVMGSQARGEQTFCTDQDNGIIFAAANSLEAEQLRLWFLPFAQAINRDLDACGIALCKGGIMAGNAACCLSLNEWRGRFAHWIRTPDPQALLNATIFFDFRAIHGDLELGDRLRDEVLRLAPESATLLRLMATNALDVEVPIGCFRQFVTDRGHGADRSLDLKTAGVRLFVDAARVMALATGCQDADTATRLRKARPALGLSEAELEAIVQAFQCMQAFRMAGQNAATRAADPEDCNRLMPAHLNPLERKILRACFEQANMIQRRIKLNFVRES